MHPIKTRRILWLVPGEENHPSSMCFVKRQLTSLEQWPELQIEAFFLGKNPSLLNLSRRYTTLKSFTKRFAPHLVHAQYGSVTAAFGVATLKRPLVISYRGSDLNPSPGDNWAKNLFGNFLSQVSAYRASYVICVSEQLQRRVWRRNVPIEIIPSGVDLRLFSPMSREQARGELGWDQNDPVVFFYAGSNPIGKGLDLANATVNFVRQKMPNLKLQILDGSVPSHLMPLYYNASDCLLMTSEHEGSPNVVKEAMSCNLPIIAVDVGDVRERLNGVLCSAITQRDSLMLGAELTKIIRLNRRSNGRDAIEKLDQRILAQQLVSIYQKLA